MASKFLLPLAVVAACCTASVLPRAPSQDVHGSWVTYPITRAARHRPLTKRDFDVPLYNVTSISYLIELSIGTPGQSVKVAIDTGSDELWVNPNCSSDDLTFSQQSECLANDEYNPAKSKTAQVTTDTTEIQYGKGFVELEYVKDNIALPGSTVNVTDAQFGVATDSSELNEGILGLGFGKGFNLPYNNLIDDLFLQNVTQTKAFGIALGSVDEDNGGTLIFGGVDTKKFTGPLITNKILGPQDGESLFRYWIEMTSIALSKPGTSKVYANSHMAVVIDSGSSLSYLPSSVVSAMARDTEGQFDSRSGLYVVPCKQLSQRGSFDFAFGQATIRVPFNEFIWQYDANTCILGAVPVDSSTGITALLGDTFMRSAFVVFDQSEKVIGLAEYVNCGENEKAIPAGGLSAGNFTGECNAKNSRNAAGRTTYSSAALVVGLSVGAMMSFL
ncbi:acid protease [Phialemonium atrogriseum]|uniref:Acid protease n=1 Tax=Phialemonium atrogriseum TaxID=1093897 RepID=A0AAJ0BT95_9PEZI|nr:acid protease [Phialemonium atrogriseum]KAK1764093.1 acid protease [Phialemonium atrogriseum]